ncbi:MAG: hypothetical protein Q9M20_01205 [Mariprofundaceae bacterium]|nr:hypothetical protein [Mariprofundaceae bacterium]
MNSDGELDELIDVIQQMGTATPDNMGALLARIIHKCCCVCVAFVGADISITL